MTKEDFEKAPDPKPSPPGQGELFEAPATARPRSRRSTAVENCPYGTVDLLSLVEAGEE
ncbi:hypothetical protein H9Y04_35590 [Streptomyces sp. TRM66268-LWL]|uniref:Uncharacterized protein n=1 Tax=Streptomyces polyasparticus TaxID=2767826 RepID=A0ABR7SU29_9ACTN|nr:hypothetical protein [Streptomyces polyasparticus]MBC9717868.1 hypothetical protein [Streptomyces polyasparticus]